MKDNERKLEADGGESLAEVELRKPRNLFVCVCARSVRTENMGTGRVRTRKRYCACASEERGHAKSQLRRIHALHTSPVGSLQDEYVLSLFLP